MLLLIINFIIISENVGIKDIITEGLGDLLLLQKMLVNQQKKLISFIITQMKQKKWESMQEKLQKNILGKNMHRGLK